MKATFKRRGQTPLLVASVLILAGCATFLTKVGFKRDEIRAPHALHASKDVECISCHETVYDETELGTAEGVMPKESVCMQCHKEKKANGECGMCHRNPDHPQTYPKRDVGLKMNHAEHIERVEEKCDVCHVNLPQTTPRLAGSTTMAACNTCHEHKQQFDAGRCDVCHTDLARFPLRPITAFSHQGDFLRRHPSEARAAGQSCALCHDQTFCTDCHAKSQPAKPSVFMPERPDRRFIHWGDYLTRHSVEARADSMTCNQCHGASFCQDCHKEQRLSPGGENPFNPHPADFNTPGSPNFHGPAARRDINSCAACHDQGAQSNCVTCHKEGGIGGNPHPPSWLIKHDRQEINRNAMCLACHL